MTTPPTLRRVTDPGDPAVAAFGELQERTYFEPDMLIPAGFIARLLTWQTPERRNALVVAELGGRVVGGTVFHAFPQVGTGFSSYLATAPEVRGQGVARQLHERRWHELDSEIGSEVGGRATGLFIDVVNPGRLSAAELGEERAVGSDPARRRAVFARLGFRQVDVAYQQPTGGEGGGPVTNMDLLYAPRDPADAVPAEPLLATMRAYWIDWLGAGRTGRALDALAAQARPDGTFRLIDPTGAG